MDMCVKHNEPLLAQTNDNIECSSSSCPPSASSEDSVPEGYLILSFDKKKKAVLKTAVFADVSDPRFADDLEDDNIGDEECNDGWSPEKSELNNDSQSVPPIKPLSLDTVGTSDEKAKSSNVSDSAYGSCYGEAVWVGEEEVQDENIDNTTKDRNGCPRQGNEVWKSLHVEPHCLVRTSPLSSETYSLTSTTHSLKSDENESSNVYRQRNFPNSRISLSLRFAKRHVGFSSWSRYVRHSLVDMNSHFSDHSRKMLRCDECGKYYRNEYSLHHHICLKRKDVWKKGDVPSEMINGQVTYYCPTCRKPFKWLGNLTRHFYVHTGQRFFRCDICSKEFFSAYQVKRHMNSHTGMRFKCEVCEKPFTCKYACAWHTRQHYAYVE